MILRMTLTVTALAFMAFGCAPANTVPYGFSYRQALEGQKLNPGPASLAPVMGLDGVAAKAVTDRYRNTQSRNKASRDSGGTQVIKSQMQAK